MKEEKTKVKNYAYKRVNKEAPSSLCNSPPVPDRGASLQLVCNRILEILHAAQSHLKIHSYQEPTMPAKVKKVNTINTFSAQIQMEKQGVPKWV